MSVSVLGQNITKYREEKGLTPFKLSKIAQVGSATIHEIENGDRQSLRSETLEKIASALDVTAGQLLGVEYETIEHEVGDLEETINSILESDFITVDDIHITDDEKEEIRDLIKFEIAAIRRRRKGNEEKKDSNL